MKQKRGSQTDPWLTKSDTIRRFLELRPKYEELCRETEYILSKRTKQAFIEISTVTSRAKTLNSFLEKLERKSYKNPFSEITDFAGVRVVCLYIHDLPLIEKIIIDEFKLIEKVDKLTEKEPDQFGYGAIHYIIQLGKKSSGARYDDLKELQCEIQVRTVLQDAWAIVDHHLVYKNESEVPKVLHRKLNSLAGLFETADDQFQQIRDQREAYIDRVRNLSKKQEEFLKTDLDLDSFREYLKWRFPDHDIEGFDGHLNFNLIPIQKAGYKKLSDIEAILNDGILKRAIEALNEMSPGKPFGELFPSSVIILTVLSLSDKSLLDFLTCTDNQLEILKKYSLFSNK